MVSEHSTMRAPVEAGAALYWRSAPKGTRGAPTERSARKPASLLTTLAAALGRRLINDYLQAGRTRAWT